MARTPPGLFAADKLGRVNALGFLFGTENQGEDAVRCLSVFGVSAGKDTTRECRRSGVSVPMPSACFCDSLYSRLCNSSLGNSPCAPEETFYVPTWLFGDASPMELLSPAILAGTCIGE
jgi:hypothetical protein